MKDEWLWVNQNPDHQFDNPEDAVALAVLENETAKQNGLNITEYPYFVVKIIQATIIKRY